MNERPAVGGLRLVGDPVVLAADGLADAQDDTAELPRAVLDAARAGGSDDRLVAPSGSGLSGWAGVFRAVLRRCGVPLLVVAGLSAGLMHLLVGRVADTVVAAPMLGDIAAGTGLLLLPLIWVTYLAMAALPIVLCLSASVAIVTSWAADGRLPGVRTVLRLILERLRRLWGWLAVFGAVLQALPILIASDALGPRFEVVLSAVVVLVSSMIAVLMGVLGCVVLFEPGRGPRRAQRVLVAAPRAGLAGLFVSSLALVLLPSMLGPAAVVVCTLGWALASLVTYAQARRAEGPVTSAWLRRELAGP